MNPERRSDRQQLIIEVVARAIKIPPMSNIGIKARDFHATPQICICFA
nr:hypothetical protein [Paraburkholderia sp. J41]